MKNTPMTPTEAFADPVAYLALFGIEAELVDHEQVAESSPLPAAA